MKILILANSDSGLYRFRKELINKLIDLGNIVYISTPKGDYQSYFESIGCIYQDTNIDRRGMNPVKDIKLYGVYCKFINEYKPDLIITYTIKCNIYGGMAARIKKIPYAINITGLGSAFENDGFLKKLVTLMYKVSAKKAKTVFFENPGNKDVFVNLNIVPEERCKVLHGAGVNLTDFKIQESNYNEDTSFLFIGRVMHEKGVDELFEVAERCKKEGLNIRFDFIGRYEENYKDKIDNLVERKIINYYGHQDDIIPFVKNVDAVILPSYHEGMSNALLEGASMGRALLATDVHGCKEAIENGVNGFTFKLKDSEDLYNKIVKFSKLSKEQQIQMGVNGRRFMEDKFDKNKVVSETINALQL